MENNTKQIRVVLIGEGSAKVSLEVTDEQLEFLENLAKALNDDFMQEDYAPKMYLKVI